MLTTPCALAAGVKKGVRRLVCALPFVLNILLESFRFLIFKVLPDEIQGQCEKSKVSKCIRAIFNFENLHYKNYKNLLS